MKSVPQRQIYVIEYLDPRTKEWYTAYVTHLFETHEQAERSKPAGTDVRVARYLRVQA